MKHAYVIRDELMKAQAAVFPRVLDLSISVQLLFRPLVSDNSQILNINYGEVKFRVGVVVYKLVFPPHCNSIELFYRHCESYSWHDAKFNNERDHAEELWSLVCNFSRENIPSPLK